MVFLHSWIFFFRFLYFFCLFVSFNRGRRVWFNCWRFGALVAPIAALRVKCAHGAQLLEPGGIRAAAAAAATLGGQRIVGLIVQTHLVWLLLLLLLWILIAQLQNLQTKRVKLTIAVAVVVVVCYCCYMAVIIIIISAQLLLLRSASYRWNCERSEVCEFVSYFKNLLKSWLYYIQAQPPVVCGKHGHRFLAVH